MPLPFTDQADRDLAACVDMMRGGSKTFFAASRLLPRRLRDASIALYAFCRVADDMVDTGSDIEQSLRQLHHRLDRIYDQQPQAFVEDRALAVVVQRHALPRHLLDALLDGFAWDGHARRYQTMEDLHGYAARVAGSVGAMMCWIMGPQQAVTLARACELGVAMQLTNIARDVGDDARMGRLYLPLDWMQAQGIDPDAWLQNPSCTPALQQVVEQVLQEADRLYRRASTGIAQLPRDCRPAIMSANLIYAEIGHRLRRTGMDPVNHRSVVSGKRKLWLLAHAWWQSQWVRSPASPPEPLAGIAYLVDQCQAVSPLDDALAWPRPPRLTSMLMMFERLERERRLNAGQPLNRYQQP